MPLPPNASITDVINKLTELEGINQKTELASVIGSPALSTDTVAQQIVKLQDSKDTLASNLNSKGVDASNTESVQSLASKVNDIPFGRVSGQATSTNSAITFRYRGGSETTEYAVTVSGLSFKPSRIELWEIYGALNRRSTFYYQNYADLTDFILIANLTTSNANGSSATYLLQDSAYVNNSGFRLPVKNNAEVYNWVAYK